MDYSKMRLTKISPHASAKVMFDHFPEMQENERMFLDADADSKEMPMHAGALCLYAATLLTKIHETSPESIECECSEREAELKTLIKAHPRFSNLTDDEVNAMAHNLILKDIRNSFAHGNFEISFDIYSKRLHFVLQPRRKDFVSDKPIIISKEALLKVNRNFAGKMGLRYMFLKPEQFDERVKTQFGTELKNFILPIDMLRLAENYLDTKKKYYEKYKPTEPRYIPLYYPLLVSQMTYEQDDYYNMFNKDSNIFAKIAHIRNSIAHDGFEFDNKTFDITHTDRDVESTDPLLKSVRMLKIVRDHKNLVHLMKETYGLSSDEHLINGIKQFFDSLFVEGGYEDEIYESDYIQPSDGNVKK